MPNDLSHLSLSELTDTLRLADELERKKCAEDPAYWLFRYGKTRDEHDDSVSAKPFPDKPYLREIIRLWRSGTMNLWPKSRQIMMSWTLCGLCLWDCQFKINRLFLIQSKKEADSDALVKRCLTLWENQPDFLKKTYRAEASYCNLSFFRPGQKSKLPYSQIRGIPQGGDQVRQYVASGIFIDEGGFQNELEAAITAAQPMVKDGGRIDVVSSAEPGYFEELVEDRVK